MLNADPLALETAKSGGERNKTTEEAKKCKTFKID
jgi:hypothetical protein